MKSLKPLFACLTICCMGLLCQNDDLIKLAQVLKELAEPGQAVMQPFATHFLYIIADTSETGDKASTMVLSLKRAFESNVPLLVTESLLAALKKYQNGSLSKSYHYFRFHNIFFPRFLLCVPYNMIKAPLKPVPEFEAISYADFPEHPLKNVSPLEKNCGLLLEHFVEKTREICITNSYDFNAVEHSPEDTGRMLKDILKLLFVPNSFYENPKAYPRWVLIFGGHGSQYKPYSDEKILKDPGHTFIQTYGSISGIDAKNFSKTIRKLAKKITIVLIHIETCYGGGITIGGLMYNHKTGILQPYNFTITTRTITGDTCVGESFAGYLNVRPDKFFSLLNGMNIGNVKEVAFIDLYNTISHALSYIVTSAPYRPIAIKPMTANYFIELQLPDTVVERIDALTVKDLPKPDNVFNTKEKSHVLLYVNRIPFTLRINKKTTIHSAIPGSTFHIFKKIEEPTFLGNNAALLFDDLFIETKEVTKLFHVENITSKFGDYEIRITSRDNDYEILVTTKKEPITFTLIQAKKRDLKNRTSTDITAEKANAWIKKFDDKIVFLKKLANAQAPYRFLKDADIETLPWDA